MEDSSPEAPPPALPEREGLFLGPNGPRAGWCLLLYIILLTTFYFSAPYVLHLLNPHPSAISAAEDGTPVLMASSISLSETILFLFVATATWIMSSLEHRPLAAYGLGRTPRALPSFLNGLAWGITLLSLLILALHASGLLVFDGRLISGALAVHEGLIWAGAFFVVALFEEYAFRGYLQFTLTRGLAGLYALAFTPARSNALGFWTAAVLLSFGFGFIHTSNAGESPIGLFAAGLVGLVFCLSLWRTGSLWWALGFHTTWDWAQSFVFGTADSGGLIDYRLYGSHPVGPALLSGGATGPEGSLYILLTLALIAAAIVLTLPRTHAGYLPADSQQLEAVTMSYLWDENHHNGV